MDRFGLARRRTAHRLAAPSYDNEEEDETEYDEYSLPATPVLPERPASTYIQVCLFVVY